MNRIIAFFVDNWRFSLILTVMIVIVGALGARMLKRETFPPVNFAQIQIVTIYPGASPEEVLDKVTKPLEDELRGIYGIKDVRSTSQSERSEIGVRIDIDNVDSTQVVSEIQRGVQRATSQLPPELPEDPIVTEIKAEEIPVLELALVGSNEGRARDRLAEDLEEQLEDVAGVKDIRLSGYRARELQVLLDPRKLQSFQVGLAEVTESVSTRLRDVPAGFTRAPEEIRQVRLIGKITDASRLENVIVRSNDSGRTLRLRDIGRVIEGQEQASVLVRVDGEPATLVVATKSQDADSLDVILGLRARLDSFSKTLPASHRLIVYNDEGQRIENRLDIVIFNAVSGMAVVLLILFVFLPGRIGILSAISLPLCMLATLTVMAFWGANFNIITMLALIICLGNLVDNSVVISEHYTRLLEDGVPPKKAAIQAAQQFWIPFTTSTITIVAAFLPMLVTKGVFGQFIRWIPIVVTIALFISLIESVTLLPARLQFLRKVKPKATSGNETGFARVEKFWAAIITRTLRHRYITIGSLGLLVLSGFAVTAVFNRFELFPSEGDEYYVLRFDLPRDSSVERTDRAAATLSQAALEVLGRETVLSVVARSGVQQTDPGDPAGKNGEHVGLVLIAIRPEIAPDLDIAQTLAKLRAIPRPEGVIKLAAETIANGPPVGKPLTVTLRSTDYDSLKAMTEKLRQEVQSIDGVLNLEIDEEAPPNEYRFVLRDEGASQSELNLDGLGLHLRTALEGFTAAELTENGREFDVVVRFDDSAKESIADLARTEVLNSRGNLVPLRFAGTFESQAGPVVRKNYDFKRSITLTGEVDDAKITSGALNSRVREIFARLAPEHPTVSPVFGGEEESTNESLESLVIALIMAVFGIFATLVFTFRSFTAPFLILSTIPLGLVGVFYAFVVDQRPLSFIAFIGVVGLSGVVINSAIILLDYIQELRATGKMSLHDALVKASSERLRAVLATGLTTVVGLVPTAFGLGGYDPILVPMTLALSWGMIIGTVLSLIWIPAGYLVLDSIKTRVIALAGRFVARG